MIGANRKSLVFWIFTILLAGVFLFLALRGVNWREMLETAQKARFEYLCLGFLISNVAFIFRAMRWRILLNAEKRVSLLIVFWSTMLGYLCNNFLPARAGEVIRSATLGRRCNISKSFVLATALTERLLDVVALVMITLIVFMFLGNLSELLTTAVKIMGIIGLVGIIGVFLAPRFENLLKNALARLPLPHALNTRLIGMMIQFLIGIRSFQNPSRAMSFFLLTIVIWLMDAFGSIITARALSLVLTLPQSLLLLAALGLSSAIPSTPGSVGIYQFVAVAVLIPFGFSRSQALAYIIVLQLLCYILVTIWGLLGLWRLNAVKVDTS
jgi:uncharacterized protein (TIRG00374 family)